MSDSRPGGEKEVRRPLKTGRVRILGATTLAFALLWIGGVHWVADYVRHLNAARLAANMILGGSESHDHGGGWSMFMPGPRPPLSAAAAGEVARLRQQTAWVEGLANGWQQAMTWVGLSLAILGLLSLLTARGRACLLATALLIFAATAGSLWALHALADPARGGMELQGNPLAEYLIVAAVQSSYGWLLLLVCGRSDKLHAGAG